MLVKNINYIKKLIVKIKIIKKRFVIIFKINVTYLSKQN